MVSRILRFTQRGVARPDNVINPFSRGAWSSLIGSGCGCAIYIVLLTLKGGGVRAREGRERGTHHIRIPNSSTILAARYSPLYDTAILVAGASSTSVCSNNPLVISHTHIVVSILLDNSHLPSLL